MDLVLNLVAFKFKYFKSEHPLKTLLKLLLLLVSKFDKSNELKEEQPENILFILFTLVVLKLDKSNEFIEEQPENIEIIFTTLEVSNLDKFNELKEEQPENILCILFTLVVLKLVKSNKLKEEACSGAARGMETDGKFGFATAEQRQHLSDLRRHCFIYCCGIYFITCT